MVFFQQIPESSPMESTEERSVDKQEEAGIKDSDATLLYAAAEVGSTDDEEESGSGSFRSDFLLG